MLFQSLKWRRAHVIRGPKRTTVAHYIVRYFFRMLESGPSTRRPKLDLFANAAFKDLFLSYAGVGGYRRAVQNWIFANAAFEDRPSGNPLMRLQKCCLP